MAKLIVLYRKPANPDAFNDYYFNIHVPIAKQIPGITAYEVSEGPVATPSTKLIPNSVPQNLVICRQMARPVMT